MLLRLLLLILPLLWPAYSVAQKSNAYFKITYLRFTNGKEVQEQDAIVLFANADNSYITTARIIEKVADYPYETTYIDRKKGHLVQLAQLNSVNRTLTIDSTTIGKQKFELTDDTKIILGHVCKRAKTEINSNKIDLWYTDKIGIKGAPTALGQNIGLVLALERNGNFAITASKIERVKINSIELPIIPENTKPVDLLSYRDFLWKARFIQIPIFKNDTINFNGEHRSVAAVEHFANGTVIAKKIKFPPIKPGNRVFVDATQRSNGDAYDRTGSIFIIPNSKINFLHGLQNGIKKLPAYTNGNGKNYQGVVSDSSYHPPAELMRFFTPFGIGHFNYLQLKNRTWQDSVFYRQEITDLASLFQDQEIWVGACISNYDKGGHLLSVNLTIHPEEQMPTVNFALPLFQTHNIMEAAGQEYPTMFDNENGLQVNFTLDHPIKNACLRYIATGHGGWENGDEFVAKTHRIFLNGNEVHRYVPWRTDCGSYRAFNPASGNFNNGLSSSDYSRSNWCPGTVTSPTYITLGDLPAGEHQLVIKINQGAPEGNSFSAWAISGVLLGKQ